MNIILDKSISLAVCAVLATVVRYHLPPVAPHATQPSARTTTVNLPMARLDGGTPTTVFGWPLLGNGSHGNSCPGAFVGYVNYTNTPPEFGWTPATGATSITAADGGGRTDTKIEYVGSYGDSGCAVGSVTIPSPPISPVYIFTIYFPTNPPAASYAYPIILTGFNP